MNNVFLIGKFNSFFKEMNDFLSGYFNVQVCVDNTELIKDMLAIKQPDIIIISMMEMDKNMLPFFLAYFLASGKSL